MSNLELSRALSFDQIGGVLQREMTRGLIWATAEDLAKNRGRVLSLYRQILRSLNSPALPLNLAARPQKKAEAKFQSTFKFINKPGQFSCLKQLELISSTSNFKSWLKISLVQHESLSISKEASSSCKLFVEVYG
ncbi:hypothetical protein K7X08_009987 [Anisodus acutangulus]|uniref:LYR motif containing domain-containing protein n=1 Tax=Anisodus acutangulus TaxID=402998 RepID=A0A9Q1N1X0_9SOLA|nr:hypothetical protein K7X08_009987 [Anisodus acutangulus]